jgi:hypothetical protein
MSLRFLLCLRWLGCGRRLGQFFRRIDFRRRRGGWFDSRRCHAQQGCRFGLKSPQVHVKWLFDRALLRGFFTSLPVAFEPLAPAVEVGSGLRLLTQLPEPYGRPQR